MLAPEASEQAAEQVQKDLSHDLMSPYCPGRTIASCPSEQARKLEEDILVQAKAGKSREEIEEVLVGRFGAEIKGYVGDPVVIYGSAAVGLIAAAMLAYLGRRWVMARHGAVAVAPAAATPAGVTAAELDALEDALDGIDEF